MNEDVDTTVCHNELIEATKLFEEAIANAANCGCNPLKQKLETTLTELTVLQALSKSTDSKCQSLKTTVLDAQSTLEESLQQCH